jgi:hypothetical protein
MKEKGIGGNVRKYYTEKEKTIIQFQTLSNLSVIILW